MIFEKKIGSHFDKSALNLFLGAKNSIWHFNLIANIISYTNGIDHLFFQYIY